MGSFLQTGVIVLVTMIFIISFCILVSIGQWKQFNGYANDSRFANIVHHLPSFVQSSKSDSTLKKYKCYFKKFERLCKSCGIFLNIGCHGIFLNIGCNGIFLNIGCNGIFFTNGLTQPLTTFKNKR
jgi:hypothetical protein